MNCLHPNPAIIHNDSKIVIKWCHECGAINVHTWGQKKGQWRFPNAWGKS